MPITQERFELFVIQWFNHSQKKKYLGLLYKDKWKRYVHHRRLIRKHLRLWVRRFQARKARKHQQAVKHHHQALQKQAFQHWALYQQSVKHHQQKQAFQEWKTMVKRNKTQKQTIIKHWQRLIYEKQTLLHKCVKRWKHRVVQTRRATNKLRRAFSKLKKPDVKHNVLKRQCFQAWIHYIRDKKMAVFSKTAAAKLMRRWMEKKKKAQIRKQSQELIEKQKLERLLIMHLAYIVSMVFDHILKQEEDPQIRQHYRKYSIILGMFGTELSGWTSMLLLLKKCIDSIDRETFHKVAFLFFATNHKWAKFASVVSVIELLSERFRWYRNRMEELHTLRSFDPVMSVVEEINQPLSSVHEEITAKWIHESEIPPFVLALGFRDVKRVVNNVWIEGKEAGGDIIFHLKGLAILSCSTDIEGDRLLSMTFAEVRAHMQFWELKKRDLTTAKEEEEKKNKKKKKKKKK